MTTKPPKRLVRVIVYSLNQYRAGCKWLAVNAGLGVLWKAPPLWPNKSRVQWWSNVYNNEYYFWFKDEHIKTLFLLSLPPPVIYDF